MKKPFIILVFLFFLLNIPLSLFGQNTIIKVDDSSIVLVSFEQNIKAFRASLDPLYFIIQKENNSLYLQALKKDVAGNIIVTLEDGSVNILVIQYAQSIETYFYQIASTNKMAVPVSEKSAVQNLKSEFHKSKIKAHGILNQKNFRSRNMAKESYASLLLNAIYVDDEFMYFVLEFDNNIKINYNIESVNLFIKEVSTDHKTTQTLRPLFPAFIYNNTEVINGGEKHKFVFVMEKFTIDDTAKEFIIRFIEVHGDRNISLVLNQKNHLNKTKTF